MNKCVCQIYTRNQKLSDIWDHFFRESSNLASQLDSDGQIGFSSIHSHERVINTPACSTASYRRRRWRRYNRVQISSGLGAGGSSSRGVEQSKRSTLMNPKHGGTWSIVVGCVTAAGAGCRAGYTLTGWFGLTTPRLRRIRRVWQHMYRRIVYHRRAPTSFCRRARLIASLSRVS